MIYQDPISSLNPRRTVFNIVNEGTRVWSTEHSQQQELKVEEMIQAVGLDPNEAEFADRMNILEVNVKEFL